MNNPYIAPTADMTMAESDAGTYQPRIFALSGRIGRLRYLAYSMLLTFLSGLPLTAYIMMQTMAHAVPGNIQYLMYLPVYAVIVLMATRRLADLGHSRWWAALMVIPLVSIIPYLYLQFKGGSDQPNEYGPPPCANTTGVVVAAWIFPAFFILGIVSAVALPAYQAYVQKAHSAQSAGSKL